MEFKIENTVPFTLAPFKKKWLGVTLTIVRLHDENQQNRMGTKSMKGQSMFLDRKTEYYQDVSSVQLNI